METLKPGMKGDAVEQWQIFLVGQGYQNVIVNEVYDNNTLDATIDFQKKNNLAADGIVGNKSFAIAMLQGLSLVSDTSTDISSANWPPPPDFRPTSSNDERAKTWGVIEFLPDPVGNGNVIITNNWETENIIEVQIPQLLKFKNASPVKFHKKGAPQFIELWNEWEKAGLLHLIINWFGTYQPRFIRGSQTALSNHAFGTAFDINVKWNMLGVVPALVGTQGSVRELVPIANKLGFYWGGHYPKRPDGMHFELVKLL